MTPKLTLALASSLALMIATPFAHAAVISIDDSAANETITLQVRAPFQITSPGDFPPGTGAFIDLSASSDVAHNISALRFNAGAERLDFTFDNQINWASDVYFYRRFAEPPGEGFTGISDLFVIQGFGGTTPDIVTFISDTTGSLGDLTESDILALVPNRTTATPSDLGTVDEIPAWQLAFSTGVDQYYIRSLIPEPGSLALLGSALVGFGLARWRRRKAA